MGVKLQHPTEESLAELLRCSQLNSFDLTWEEEESPMLAPSSENWKVYIHTQVRIECVVALPWLPVHLSMQPPAVWPFLLFAQTI